MESDREGRKRSDYAYFLSYRTRWIDNDQYSHMNNAVYYHLYDSIVNDYLARHCGVQATSSPMIGLVVTSSSDFYRPVGYPQVLELGLRVLKLGRSSATYEVGVFEEEVESAAAVGRYTHVFVESGSKKPGDMSKEIREGLEKLIVAESKSKL